MMANMCGCTALLVTLLRTIRMKLISSESSSLNATLMATPAFCFACRKGYLDSVYDNNTTSSHGKVFRMIPVYINGTV